MPAKKKAVKKSINSVDVPDEILMGLFENLLTTRMLDERLRKLFRQGRYAGTYFSAVGQEATTVCPSYGLRDEDIIAPSHREIGASVTKGVPLNEIVAQIYARQGIALDRSTLIIKHGADGLTRSDRGIDLRHIFPQVPEECQSMDPVFIDLFFNDGQVVFFLLLVFDRII